jgi:Domain of unknown function (DUF4375)
MEFIGSIQSASDPPGIDKSRWHHVIQNHPKLALNEPKETINPFTKEPMVVEPNPDVARVIVDTREVGAMRWAKRGANEIHVFGDKDAVSPVAHEIAELLSARFDPDALQARSPAGRVFERVAKTVRIYDEPDIFLNQFNALKPQVGHLFAAHWCQSEVRNGGFHQFFYNPTGVLAPEALAGFRAMGLDEWAEVLEQAMQRLPGPYQRDREMRIKVLERVTGDQEAAAVFRDLDKRFYAWLKPEAGRYEKIADEYANALQLDSGASRYNDGESVHRL